jgi:hypothetical protein
MAWTMNLPPSEEPCREWSFEKFVKLDKPRMRKIIELVKENLIPSVNIIMIRIREYHDVGEWFGRIRRQIPLIFRNESGHIKMMIKKFFFGFHLHNGTDSNGFC